MAAASHRSSLVARSRRTRYNRRMAQTLGYHIVIAGYGLWLPGDERGSWSTTWDEQLGLIEPHALHPGDPIRLRMSEERLKQTPVRLSHEMAAVIANTLADCASRSDWSVAALCVMSTHAHMLLTPTERHIDTTVKWIKDQMTKAIHQRTAYQRPVWCKGKWRSFIFDLDVWESTRTYIEKHNVRRGMVPRPYAFVESTFPT